MCDNSQKQKTDTVPFKPKDLIEVTYEDVTVLVRQMNVNSVAVHTQKIDCQGTRHWDNGQWLRAIDQQLVSKIIIALASRKGE